MYTVCYLFCARPVIYTFPSTPVVKVLIVVCSYFNIKVTDGITKFYSKFMVKTSNVHKNTSNSIIIFFTSVIAYTVTTDVRDA